MAQHDLYKDDTYINDNLATITSGEGLSQAKYRNISKCIKKKKI
jgi:hypothetical protein